MSNTEYSGESSAFTLTDALCRLAGEHGAEFDRDMVHAALGLCWGTVAGEDDTPIGDWSGLARDRFLVPAAMMFGIRVRGLHPPAAAKDLHAAAEFAQHFDASYRPLIHRALEHGQPVLAWRGWDSAPPLHWGIIRGVSDRGIGFVGEVPCGGTSDGGTMEPQPSREEEHAQGEGDAPNRRPRERHGVRRDPGHARHPNAAPAPASRDEGGWRSAALAHCPTQVYAVEVVEPRMPASDDLTALVLDHAGAVLAGERCVEFGVLTGAAAIDRWISRIRDNPRPAPGCSAATSGAAAGQASRAIMGRPSRDGHARCEVESHAALAASLLAAVDAGERAIELLLPAARSPVSIRRLAALGDGCRCVHETMGHWPDAEAWHGLLSTEPGRRQVVEHLQLVRERLGSCAVAVRAGA